MEPADPGKVSLNVFWSMLIGVGAFTAASVIFAF